MGLWETLKPKDIKKRLLSFPAAFLTIGVAIGMVLLFYFFEEAIKSWGGFFPLATPAAAFPSALREGGGYSVVAKRP
jgi:hypothetical protein